MPPEPVVDLPFLVDIDVAHLDPIDLDTRIPVPVPESAPASMGGNGRLYGKIHRDGPWALVRWRPSPNSLRMVEPVARFAAREEAEADAAILPAGESWTIVRTDRTGTTRILDDERPAYDDDYLDDDLDDDDPEPCSAGSSRTTPTVDVDRPASAFSFVVSRIPPTRIAGSGVLAADAVADRQLAQVT
jgi:hypothetical protein